MRSLILSSIFSLSLISNQAPASNAERDFVEANILGIFYHELGHALIDIEAVSIFGQEEDAADTFSIYLIDAMFDDETANALAYDAALGFLAEAEDREVNGEEISWWDVHGPDEQRFFNTICIFYGADPKSRTAFSEDLGLPKDRAETCPEEFDQAHQSWGALLDGLIERGPGQTLQISGSEAFLATKVLREEVAALNERFSLSRRLSIVVEPCAEANAFYDPEASKIVFCSEFEAHLEGIQRMIVEGK